jgi:hypothetical protein
LVWNTTWDSLVGRIDLLLGNDRLGARAFRDLAVPAGVPRVDQTQARYHHAA